MPDRVTQFEDILALCPLRSGAFIVTVFGDVAFPGGGELWIGHLIDLCDRLGISETLVRTSVSRLVAAGQLVGTRHGRRSYYALTPDAQDDFDRAARVIYAPPQERPWRFLFFPLGHSPDVLDRLGMAAVSDKLGFGPARADVPDGAVAFTAHADGDAGDLATMLAQVYPLDALAQDCTAFQALARTIAALPATDPQTALQARLILTHAWRMIALRAPRLPVHLLPNGHPEPAARAAFGREYLNLCPLAEQHAQTILTMTPPQAADRDTVLAARCATLKAGTEP